VGLAPFAFWQKAVPTEAKPIAAKKINPIFVTIPQVTSRFLISCEIDISQNPLDANQIISFHWVSFRLKG